MIGDTVRRLLEEREQRPELAGAFDLYLALFSARAAWSRPPGPLDRARVESRVMRGLPALDARDLDLDWPAVAGLARAVCAAGARHHPTLAPAFTDLGVWLAGLPVEEVRRLALGHFHGDEQNGVLGFVLTQALQPHLAARVTAIADTLGGAPAGPRCPACGGRPDFAALDAESGGRHLLCSRCDHEWPWRRLGCPYCGNEAPESLGYFEAGPGGAYRLYVCERCQRYLKTVDLRETWQRRPLPVERILTLGMDVAALAEGYRPC